MDIKYILEAYQFKATCCGYMIFLANGCIRHFGNGGSGAGLLNHPKVRRGEKGQASMVAVFVRIEENAAPMTRSELIASIGTRFPSLVAADVEISVKEILGAISDALAKDDRIEIRGFGSFSLNYRPSRIGRNPKTEEAVVVPAKYAPHFKPGQKLRERVDPSSAASQDAV